MKRGIHPFAYISALVVSASGSAQAQDGIDEFLHKIGAEQIVADAIQGKEQEVLVELDVGSTEKMLAKERAKVADYAERRRNTPGVTAAELSAIAEDARRQDGNLLQTLRSHLASYKSAVFVTSSTGAEIVRDFEHSPIVLAKIRSVDALRAIVSNQFVKTVNKNLPVRPAANWPTSYSDISIIHSNIRTGAEGKTGSDTRVAILDTASSMWEIPGWNPDAISCRPYLGDKFYESNLGIGKTAVSANCRVWSAYNFSSGDLFDVCAAAYSVDETGTQEKYPFAPCYKSGWQHGTLMAQVVARTAPGAWLTMLQIFDKAGKGNSSYIVAALDWLIEHAYESPRIAAANLSIAEGELTKYGTACPSTPLASRLEALLDNGIVPVVAAGNQGWIDGVNSPACVPGVLAVGATTDSTTSVHQYKSCYDQNLFANQVPCFSNSDADLLSLFAPGVDIGNSTPYVASDAASILRASGTSPAAAHVSGAVAILRGKDAFGATKTANQIVDILSSAGPILTDRRNSSVKKPGLDIAAALHVANKLSISPNPASVKIGSTLQLVVTAEDLYGQSVDSPALTFSSSNTSLATVDSSGLVKGIAAGTVTIRVSSGSVASSSSLTVSTGRTGTPSDPCKVDPTRCQ